MNSGFSYGRRQSKKENYTIQIGVVLIILAAIGKIIWYFSTGWSTESIFRYDSIRTASSYVKANYSGYDDGYWSSSEMASDVYTQDMDTGYPETPPIYSGMEGSGFDDYSYYKTSEYFIVSKYGKEEVSKAKWLKSKKLKAEGLPLIAELHYGKFWGVE
tara:strand:- start:461 stop:937 length:477 start_codon:yes stop_codon:yes gene_type:complete